MPCSAALPLSWGDLADRAFRQQAGTGLVSGDRCSGCAHRHADGHRDSRQTAQGLRAAIRPAHHRPRNRRAGDVIWLIASSSQMRLHLPHGNDARGRLAEELLHLSAPERLARERSARPTSRTIRLHIKAGCKTSAAIGPERAICLRLAIAAYGVNHSVKTTSRNQIRDG